MGRGQQNDESAKKGCDGSNQNDLSSWLGYRRRRQENTAFFREAGLKWWRVAKLQQYNELYWSGDRIRTCDPLLPKQMRYRAALRRSVRKVERRAASDYCAVRSSFRTLRGHKAGHALNLTRSHEFNQGTRI